MRALLLVLFITFSLCGHAQIQKGSTLLGGSLNFNSGNKKGTGFGISGQYGKAYKENTFRGFQLGYNHSDQTGSIANVYFGGIFYRRYVPVIKQFYFFGEVNLNAGYSNSKLTPGFSGPSAVNTQIISYYGSLSLIPGLSYAVNSKLHLEIVFLSLANLYYAHNENKNTSGGITISDRENSFGLNTSTQLNLLSNVQFGFRFLLQKKKR